MAVTLEEIEVVVKANVQGYENQMAQLVSQNRTKLGQMMTDAEKFQTRAAKAAESGNMGLYRINQNHYKRELQAIGQYSEKVVKEYEDMYRRAGVAKKAHDLLFSKGPSAGGGGGGGFGAGGSFLSQAFGSNPLVSGFLFGGAAGAAGAIVGQLVQALGSLSSQLIQLGQSAVQAAAGFEVSQNALTAMVGSSSQARAELLAIDEVARNTTGLRMVEAEQGYTRLRALGFEAKTATDLIAGLAKQKLLSGADAASMERVLVNLQQLSSGSARASMDVKEMIHAMPTLVGPMLEVFGTLNFGQIGKEIGKNPKVAMEEFAKALAGTTQAQGGLNNSIDKFYDSWITVGRALAEPLLPTLTADITDFNSELNKSSNYWSEWGKTAADVLSETSAQTRDYINLWAYLQKEMSQIGAATTPAKGSPLSYVQSYLDNLWSGIKRVSNPTSLMSEGLSGVLAQSGVVTRSAKGRFNDTENQQMLFEEFMAKKPKIAQAINSGQISKDQLASLYGKSATPEAFLVSINKLWEESIKAQTKGFERLKENAQMYYSERQAINQAYTSSEQARINQEITYTVEQEAAKYEKLNSNKQRSLQEEKADLIQLYDAKIAAAQGTVGLAGEENKEVIALQSEKRNALRRIDGEITSNSYDAARQRALFQKQIRERERAAAVQHASILAEMAKSSADYEISELKRRMDDGFDLTAAGYDKIKSLRQSLYASELSSLKTKYENELADLGLSESQKANLLLRWEEEKANIRRKFNQDEISDEKEKHAFLLRLISERYERIQKQAQDAISFSDKVSGIDMSNLSQSALKEIAQLVNMDALKGPVKTFSQMQAELNALNQEQASLKAAVQANPGDKNLYDRWKVSADEYHKSLKALASSYFLSRSIFQESPQGIFLGEDLKTLGEGGSKEKFKLSWVEESIRSSNQLMEAQSAKAMADYMEEKRLFDIGAGSKVKVDSAFANFSSATSQQVLTYLDNLLKKTAAVRDTLPGAQAALQELLDGAQDQNLADAARRQSVERQIKAVTELRAIELGYYKDTTAWGQERALALAKVTKDVWEAEQQAITDTQVAYRKLHEEARFSINAVQANVAKFLDSQMNLTELMSESLTNSMQSWYDTVNKGFDALVSKLGLADTALGAFISHFLSGMANIAATKFFSWLMNAVFAGLGGSSGGGTALHEGLHATPFASGGYAQAGRMALVGEQGPELFVPGTGGIVMTNEETRKLFSAQAVTGGRVINNFNFYPHRETGRFSRESAEQAVRKLTLAQQRMESR